MLDKIANYFNNNPIVAILLVLLVLIVIWRLFRGSCGKNEYLDPTISLNNLPKCDPNTDQEFYKEFVGSTKLVNFKCTYNGKEYYLASVKTTDCSNITPEQLSTTLDCPGVALVLLDKLDIDSQVKQYLIDLENDTKICNFKKNLECTSNKSEESKCQSEYQECKSQRFFNHDFIVTEIIQQPTVTGIPPRRKYIIRGTAQPLRNGKSHISMLNQHLYEEQGINFLCGDDYAYGSDQSKNRYTELHIVEKPKTTQTNILGDDTNKFVNLIMLTHVFVEGVDPKTNKKTINHLYDQNNTPRLMTSYVSACEGKLCTINGRDYVRVCLQGDPLSLSILNFEPVLSGSFTS